MPNSDDLAMVSFSAMVKPSPMEGRQDSKLGVEIVIPKGSYSFVERPPSTDYLATSPSTSTLNDSTDRRNHAKRDVPFSRRAKQHLRRHGLDVFGRDYASFPKSMTFDAASKLVLASCTGIGTQQKNALSQWMMEPVNMSEGDLSFVTTSAICNQMRDTIGNGGVMFGIEEDEVLKACLIYREIDPSKGKPNGPLKRCSDVLAQNFSIVPPIGLGTTNLEAEQRRRRAVGEYVNRALHLEDAFTEWHESYSPQHTHWYLSDVAVAPIHQGKGFGQEMMTTFCKLADRYQVEVYLECGTGVTDFFLAFGFKEVALRQAWTSNEEPGNTLEVSILVRTPTL